MLILILYVLALVFGALAVFSVPGRVSWSGCGVVCLALAALIARGGLA